MQSLPEVCATPACLLGKQQEVIQQCLFLASELKKRAEIFPFQPIYLDSKDLKCGPFRRARLNAGASEGASETSEKHKILSAAHRKGHRCLFKLSAHATVTHKAANKARLLSNNPDSGPATVWGISEVWCNSNENMKVTRDTGRFMEHLNNQQTHTPTPTALIYSKP